MAEHGGYRAPANPAPVSGPGAHSRRTDGGPGHPSQVLSTAPDQPYGEQKAQLDAQRAAPMGGAQPMPDAAAVPGGQAGPGGAPFQPGDLTGPSQMPDQHVTHGVDIGPGAGTEALSMPQQGGAQAPSGAMTTTLRNLSATDTTGVLAELYSRAAELGV